MVADTGIVDFHQMKAGRRSRKDYTVLVAEDVAVDAAAPAAEAQREHGEVDAVLDKAVGMACKGVAGPVDRD